MQGELLSAKALAAQPTHTETLPAGDLRARLRAYRAVEYKQYSTAARLVFWAPVQRVWIAVEGAGHDLYRLSLYTTCPCQSVGAPR